MIPFFRNSTARALLLAALLPATALPSAGQDSGSAVAETFAGTWTGSITLPFDPLPLQVRFGLEAADDGAWVGAFDGDMFGPGLLAGTVTDGALEVTCDMGGDESTLRLTPGGEGDLRCLLGYRGIPVPVSFSRSDEGWAEDLHFEVDLPEDRPTTVTLDGLPDFWLEAIEPRITEFMDRESAVGLALAVVIDGELVDDRAWGWRDVAADDPVDGETLFRWASISKSVTGVLAAKLAVAGELDLDADVRALVPEYPEKEFVVTTRQLLGHLGGAPHYQHMPVVTRTDHGVEFPFRDPVRAIDMFRAAPLIHEPGSAYSYSTHGFALAGAVLERSSERGFKGEVEHRVSAPLGMTTFEPDDPTARRAARTVGYRVAADGRVFESGDTDVSWKLAGGGFQSTVADMARFAVGLCDAGYLSPEERHLLWTSQATTAGEETGYGLGFRVARRDGRLEVSHGGAQRRTATYLLTFPEERIAIALMCNTEGARPEGLAYEIARVLFDE